MKPSIKLRLIITGGTESGRRALDNLEAVCGDPRIRRDYDIELEVVDATESPRLAEQEEVLVTPILLKTQPPPVRRLVGDLSQRRDVLAILDIEDPGSHQRGCNGNSA